MSVSIAAMTLAELQAWMALHPVYVTVAEAIEAGALVAQEAVGLGGVAITVAGETAAAVDATVTGATILDFAEAAELLAHGQKVTTSGVGLLKGSSGFSLSAVLGVELGTIAAAAAPILGVALGANLYASNPDLWTKISRKLLPFCYPGTTKIPTWAEVAQTAWATSIPKKIIDALKDLFEEENIPYVGSSSEEYTYEDKTVIGYNYLPAYPDNVTYTGISGGIIVRTSSNQATSYSYADPCAISHRKHGADLNNNHNNSYTSGGNTILYYGPISGSIFQIPDTQYYDSSETARILLEGTSSPAGEYQPGTSKWSGGTPATIPLGKPAVVSTDGTTEPMVPISIPLEVDPDESNPEVDPELQPDPTETTDPEKQVAPYIMPSPVPWDIYAPDTDEQTQTDPELDPTIPRPPTEIITNPPIDLGPSPIGISPWPAMPGTPMAFAQNVGLITVYHPTPAELYAFESWLWVTLANADINTVWNNPFDGVITLFELYCTPTDVGNRTIHSGFLDSGINSAVISRYTEINCGTYAIPEYYGNYLDYSPYSKAHVYLPFIGVQELNVDDIVGHAVNITYRIDEYNGSCIAMITVAKTTEVNGETVEYSNTMYQFSGNCAVELPISGGSQAQIKAGLMMANAYQTAANISAGANLLGGLGSLIAGNVGGAIQGLGSAASSYAYGQANALSHMLSGKSTVQKSGQFGSSYGAMGIKTPFITITRPKQIQVPNYNELYGYPAHKMVTVGACTGFLRCREVHVISPTASDEEKALIENLMKSGVYVTE